ncbi:fibronectin type III domain-containing protein [Pedobacter endophyticus]|uniref:Fibronectin type III domain-containing protein n=1 Tax=Pedobacter endophyticus TaxID=2789740 RepID=A0A7S9KZ01_9SPHI|nr:fibronectin type III domain-containing protein [Pedobacter endophyticus]QPH39432.1 fibronectin type III domain-containing protein [Pedobacter endophyticus]
MQKASLLGRLALHFQAMGFTLNLKPFAFYLTLVFLLSALSSSAQIYPVQVTPVLVPPYSLNTSDYYNGTTERLAIVLTNTDLQKPVLSVRLRMYIEGQNAKLQSKDGVYYPTITLDAGIPQRISLGDLAPYFNVDNLNFSGITRSMYAQNSKLPEGFYSFCFEAIEVYTGQVLSRKSCSMAYITLSDPPLLNIPVKGESIASREVQNIIFQWTPRNLGSPNGAFNTEYEFTLKELWDTGIAPEAAFHSTQPLYQVTVRPTTLLMGPAEPQLIPGKRYAWRVRAVSTSPMGEQLDSYRNNGFSEIYWFTYQSDCRPPLAINSSVTSGRVTISWTPDPTNNGTPAGGYTLQYRERTLSASKWYSVNTLENRAVLYDLKPGTTYEYRVGSSCVPGNIGIGTDQTTYSDILTLEISGDPNDTRTVNCGMISPEIAIANRTPIQALNQGDLIMAGSFPVKITRVSPSGGGWEGEGYVTIPMLGQANVKVRFSGIQVNTERQLFAGVIETTYDVKETQIVDTKEIEESIKALADVVKKLITTSDKIDKLLEKDVVSASELKDLQQQLASLTVQKDSLTKSAEMVTKLNESIPTYINSAGGASVKDNTPFKEALSKTSAALKADAAAMEEKQFSSFVTLYNSKGYGELLYKLYKIYQFYDECSKDNWKPYKDAGIVPYCFWKNANTSESKQYTFLDRPYTAGVLDGLYIQVYDLAHLGTTLNDLRQNMDDITYAYSIGYMECKGIKSDKLTIAKLKAQLIQAKKDSGFSAWWDNLTIPNKLAKIKECKEQELIRNETEKVINNLYEIISNQERLEKAINTIAKQLNNYFEQLNGTSDEQRYEHGKIVSNIATLLIGTGETKAGKSIIEALEYLATKGKGTFDDIGKRLLGIGKAVKKIWSVNDKQLLKLSSLKQGFLNSSDELMGIEKASDELIAAVSKKRRVVIAKDGSEELRMLEYFSAEASVGGEDMASIILRENPSKAAILEEFLHGTQHKLGIIDDLGRYNAEAHVKDFMIRHQKMLGLSDKDIAILKRLKDLGL